MLMASSMVHSFPLAATLALGFVLGLKHALDADHLAAVSTFASEYKSVWRSSLVGVYWGLGHSAALLVFGAAVILFRLTLTARVSQYLDFAVGCMLILLGVNVFRKLRKDPVVHVHTHEHDGTAHSHLHFHAGHAEHDHSHRVFRVGGKPFVVGVVHGLAGTAAVLLLFVSTIPSILLAFATILIFGAGTIGGMMVMSALMSVPVALAAGRLAAIERGVRLAAGLFSFGFGVFLAWDVGLLQAFFH